MIKRILVLSFIAAALIIGCKENSDTVAPPSTSNHAPNTPSNPSPSDGATNVSRFVTMSWKCSDPDQGDTVRYDLYWGTNNSTGNVGITNSLLTSFDLGLVAANVTIYWRVVAKDNKGAYTNGPTWKFTTGS